MNRNSPTYVIVFMVVICLVFGTGIAVVHYATLPITQRNQALIINRQVCQAFQLDIKGTKADDYEQALNASVDSLHIQTGDRTWQVFRRKDAAGPAEVGFVLSGVGFWDEISCIMVLSSDFSKIVNLRILKQSETPGLGARIEESWFTDQFKGLTVAWDQPVDKRIVIGPSPNPLLHNRVDGITGATQTSVSMQRFINSNLEVFRTAYFRYLETAPVHPHTKG